MLVLSRFQLRSLVSTFIMEHAQSPWKHLFPGERFFPLLDNAAKEHGLGSVEALHLAPANVFLQISWVLCILAVSSVMCVWFEDLLSYSSSWRPQILRKEANNARATGRLALCRASPAVAMQLLISSAGPADGENSLWCIMILFDVCRDQENLYNLFAAWTWLFISCFTLPWQALHSQRSERSASYYDVVP